MTTTFPTLEDHIIEIDESQAQHIAEFLRQHSFNPYASDDDFERLISRSITVCQVLPSHVLEGLLEFRAHGNDDGVLIIRGLPIDEERIGSTPTHWSRPSQTKQSYDTEMYILGLSSILGDVFAFNTQHHGNLIQNILPIESDAYEQMGTNSRVFLEWHNEDAFHQLRADFIGLLCLRSDPLAATTFASVKRMNLPDAYKKCLFEKRFRVTCFDDTQAGLLYMDDGPELSLLYGSYDEPYARYDVYCIRSKANDPEAQEALTYFEQHIAYAARQIVLQKGDLLFFNNHRVMHGRAAFTPKFDGTDRWLQRVSIATDLQKSRSARTKRLRVIEMDRRFLGE